jgi:divinyl chlorophyllide a 8-vinyl-reductase
MLFDLMGKPPKFKRVPVALLDVIIAVLSTLGRVVPALAVKSELARIGRYYATESMLVLNPDTKAYDESATPSYGTQTLMAYYADVIKQQRSVQLGDHSVF